MSTKRKIYSADFKAKLVLEVLNSEKTINEIASQYEGYFRTKVPKVPYRFDIA